MWSSLLNILCALGGPVFSLDSECSVESVGQLLVLFSLTLTDFLSTVLIPERLLAVLQ
jgi:hypothetical protein